MMENPIKIDDLGVPLFSETSISPRGFAPKNRFCLKKPGEKSCLNQPRGLHLDEASGAEKNSCRSTGDFGCWK